MLRPMSTRRRRRALALGAASLALVAAGLTTGQATAGSAPRTATPAAASAASAASASPKGGETREVAGNYDSRTASSATVTRHARATQRARGSAVARLSRSLGNDTSVSLDALSGTPSDISSRLGFLTGPSTAPAARIALGFVRAHLDAFGLGAADLATLVETRRVTDLNGITHVFWNQRIAGIDVFGNGLRAHVDKTGRLISVQGAPVAGATAQVSRAASPRLDRAAALRAAARDARSTTSTGVSRAGATAQRVWFLTPTGLRAGWSTYTQPSGTEAYQHVIDATSGRTLYRHSTINFEKGDAYVHENYPGARGSNSGGRQHVVNLYDLKYLPRSATWLRGRYASVWADLNDDDAVQANEKTRVPGLGGRAQFAFKPFPTADGEAPCTAAYQCTWDPSTPYSWKKNKNQDGVQGLYFTSKYAQWLKRAPFGFTAALGNFERADGDEVHLQSMDGGNTAGGLPDDNHVNNANFNTPPDGRAPIMQMYLNHSPYLAASSSNAFDNIGHEYTHGLSNRLVVDSMGNSTLNSYQGGSMGEGWSDLYSFDYLLAHRLLKNDPDVSGELMYDRYLSKDRAFTRTQAIDCAVGDDARLCKQVDGVGVGGYTFGDIPGQLTTEVHAAGEVWAQTLWDLHEKLGHGVTMRLVTSAMTLAPTDPSMLDMRDSIITADKVIYGKAHTRQIWKTFAHRGFGYFAASIDAGDATPAEDFHVPPAGNQAPGAISGTVTDTNGDPIPGAIVLVAGHTSGVAGSYSDVTSGDGTYLIDGVVPGTYPKVVALADGYQGTPSAATVASADTVTTDFVLRRNWAAASGGASVEKFDGVDYSSFGCGPGGLIDVSQGTGWGSTTGATEDPVTAADQVVPKSIVIALPKAIDITAFAVDPGATCGDPGSASTADYTIEVSTTAAGPWVQVSSGTFDTADQGVLVPLPVTAPPGQSFVRYTMVNPQVPDYSGCPDAYGGCAFMDSSELAVFND